MYVQLLQYLHGNTIYDLIYYVHSFFREQSKKAELARETVRSLISAQSQEPSQNVEQTAAAMQKSAESTTKSAESSEQSAGITTKPTESSENPTEVTQRPPETGDESDIKAKTTREKSPKIEQEKSASGKKSPKLDRTAEDEEEERRGEKSKHEAARVDSQIQVSILSL